MGNYIASCQDLATTAGQIQAAGLDVGDIATSPDAGLTYTNSWLVVDQEPDPGTFVPVGADVHLTVELPKYAASC